MIHVSMVGNQRYVTIYFASIVNLKCTPSDRQMYPQGYMYPRLGTSGLAQPFCKCCNHSVSVVLNVRIATNRMYVKNNTHIYASQTSRNRMSTTWDLYCCMLPQCEALHTCRLGFPITAKWCFDQDLKVVPGATQK